MIMLDSYYRTLEGFQVGTLFFQIFALGFEILNAFNQPIKVYTVLIAQHRKSNVPLQK